MGQEISQQSKLCDNNNNNNTNNNLNRRRPQSIENQKFNEKYTKHNHPDSIYALTSNFSTSSTCSTTDDENYRQRQKYNFHKQAFEKTKLAKKFSLQSKSNLIVSKATTVSKNNSKNDTDTYEDSGLESSNKRFYVPERLRRNSQSTDSGFYYSSCYCSSSAASSVSLVSSGATSSTSGCSTTAGSNKSQKSHKSLDKQKQYLNHHLYIKSYLDILEEDEKARANYKPARPGGIRNYTPKILAETSIEVNRSAKSGSKLSSSTNSTGVASVNLKEDPWI